MELLVLIIIVFIAYLLIRWSCYSDTFLYRYLFQDKNDKFAWAGFTSVIAIITIAVTAWDNRRKFKADLISKSRIEWINRTKDTLSRYVALERKVEFDLGYMNVYRESSYLYSKLPSDFPDLKEFSTKLDAQIKIVNDRQSEIQVLLNNLEMTVSDSDDNKAIKNLIFLVNFAKNNFDKKLKDDFQKNKKLIDQEIKFGKIKNNSRYKYTNIELAYLPVPEKIEKCNMKLVSEASKYFKREWEKAKRGE